MVITSAKPTSLETFLNLPETKPASEFLNGQINQKPMSQGEHSLLQGTLCQTINKATQPNKLAIAFPELRCTFGGASIVPDLSIFRWDRIPRNESGRISNRFEIYPDWAIEILSPEQRQNKVLANLLHCAEHGTKLGWLLDPEDENILVVFGDRHVQIFQGSSQLPILPDLELELTVEQIFSWLCF
ncbi:Putative restriction endonuclease domain-containing protein [Tumidithrix helvetica PCC 7403]|uniref:Uma2 family endonuclease n=1 Tax=Tumidithrix helvetica TaxID=3457545 RepID=UPI003CA6B1E3